MEIDKQQPNEPQHEAQQQQQQPKEPQNEEQQQPNDLMEIEKQQPNEPQNEEQQQPEYHQLTEEEKKVVEKAVKVFVLLIKHYVQLRPLTYQQQRKLYGQFVFNKQATGTLDDVLNVQMANYSTMMALFDHAPITHFHSYTLLELLRANIHNNSEQVESVLKLLEEFDRGQSTTSTSTTNDNNTTNLLKTLLRAKGQDESEELLRDVELIRIFQNVIYPCNGTFDLSLKWDHNGLIGVPKKRSQGIGSNSNSNNNNNNNNNNNTNNHKQVTVGGSRKQKARGGKSEQERPSKSAKQIRNDQLEMLRGSNNVIDDDDDDDDDDDEVLDVEEEEEVEHEEEEVEHEEEEEDEEESSDDESSDEESGYDESGDDESGGDESNDTKHARLHRLSREQQKEEEKKEEKQRKKKEQEKKQQEKKEQEQREESDEDTGHVPTRGESEGDQTEQIVNNQQEQQELQAAKENDVVDDNVRGVGNDDAVVDERRRQKIQDIQKRLDDCLKKITHQDKAIMSLQMEHDEEKCDKRKERLNSSIKNKEREMAETNGQKNHLMNQLKELNE